MYWTKGTILWETGETLFQRQSRLALPTSDQDGISSVPMFLQPRQLQRTDHLKLGAQQTGQQTEERTGRRGSRIRCTTYAAACAR